MERLAQVPCTFQFLIREKKTIAQYLVVAREEIQPRNCLGTELTRVRQQLVGSFLQPEDQAFVSLITKCSNTVIP